MRRAFLCGEDKQTGQSYEHRREWIADKLKSFSDLFSIDIAAYSVMNNHYHIVVRVDKEQAQQWSHRTVIERWGELFKLPIIITNFLKGEPQSSPELKVVDKIVEEWHERLYSASWYMRILNEHIAREANKEDNVTGRFWEGRFKSQALLDEQALIACMAYVDLNPVRAGITSTPDASNFTSIQERIQKAMRKHPCTLLGFDKKGITEKDKQKAIPFELNEYIALVDWSGRAILHNKRGSIPENIPPILHRLGIDEKDWVNHIHYFERQLPTVAGNIETLRQLAEQTSRR